MYCSSCGVAVAQGVSYCNYCGGKLGGGRGDDDIEQAELKPGLLVCAMVSVFVFGLVAITILMGIMKAVIQLESGQILGFAALCFLIMVSLEAIFVRLLFRGNRGNRGRRGQEAGDKVLSKGQTTKELEAAHARALPEPVPSVTEHTTRAFAPIYPERTSK